MMLNEDILSFIYSPPTSRMDVQASLARVQRSLTTKCSLRQSFQASSSYKRIPNYIHTDVYIHRINMYLINSSIHQFIN